MAPTWWDSAYRSGHVPWDPGAFDGHLPRLLRDFQVQPGSALDIGCGEGKSLFYLAERGFRCTGIDLSPVALRTAEEEARQRGIACRWLTGEFPEDFRIRPSTETVGGSAAGDNTLAAQTYGLIMERGCFQHLGRPGPRATRFAESVARLLAPSGIYYSLIAADQGRRGVWGPRWSERAVRGVLEEFLEVLTLELSVFTPGERGSMGAWFCVARRREGGGSTG
jgi:SAM-dependent methyltransferase